jgi:hypothetical protein
MEKINSGSPGWIRSVNLALGVRRSLTRNWVFDQSERVWLHGPQCNSAPLRLCAGQIVRTFDDRAILARFAAR